MKINPSNKMRCQKCFSLEVSCFCQKLEKVNSNLSWSIIMHCREYHLSSNTGRLARNTLPNCDIHIRGLKEEQIDWTKVIPKNKKCFMLFPDEKAIDLTELQGTSPQSVHFIVPDGSWNQAKKVKRREPALESIQTVKLPDRKYTSNYLCRKQPKPNFLCTYESMEKVIEILEGQKEIKKMQHNLKTLTTINLKNRRHYSKEILKLSL